MDKNSNDGLISLLAALGAAGIAVAFYVAALTLPESRFEPMGSAAVPKMIAVIVFICAAFEVVRCARLLLADPSPLHNLMHPGSAAIRRAATVIGYILFFFAIVLVLQSAVVPFMAIAAVLFWIGALFIGVPRTRTMLLALGLVGLVLGVGLELIFTRVFFVNIPAVL
ncbi:hypothetical protein ACFPOD_07960 [Nitratireductor kimnyeongensis]|uniref:Tripartite tricarboxylate transporter TctB family protein n=1 Tax=Nitratireductor kimnyeongensis TaxID=430679 RepID=A0ABW0T6N8_9HYPH|nr:hypothetical protein [Nitratireductor kimnyeongensis]QZZ34021.1 hypothetical protein KW403_09250 [Nitratireductor kimnyeongensis]